MNELKHLGRYEIVRALGSGVMGVYEGIDARLNRRVAIKTIPLSALTDPEQAADRSERFMREAQAVAGLKHSNIVSVYDFGKEGDVAYFVMEFIEGKALKEYLEGGVKFSLPKSLGLMIDLLGALDYAHTQGIVHRDINPGNILIDLSGRLKLTGLGVKAQDRQEHMQAVVGMAYMSPEQLLGTGVSHRSDIFAAGAVLYQLLTWKQPFAGDGLFTTQQKIANEYPAPPSTVDATLPPFLDQVINRALAKDPLQRYAHASEFADDLRRFLAMDAIQQAGSAGRADEGGEKTISTASEKGEIDIEKLLDEKAKLDSMFEEKFHKFVTVMFTDLKGSTMIAENEGDLVSRMMIKAESDILLPAIKENNGTFVKSIGDGSLSYFENALDAVRAAARIQKEMDALNMSHKFRFPVLMRIGMHSGKCVVEEKDIYGDVVNTASRFESAADGGGILISEDTYEALSDKTEIYCRFVKQVTLKGKKEPFNAYKAFWNPREIELDKQGKLNGAESAAKPAKPSGNKLIWVAAVIGVILLLFFAVSIFKPAPSVEKRRSLGDTAAPAETQR